MLKVNAHGVQGDAARWIRNWLAGRRQRVWINQSYSNWATVTSDDLPVLGPVTSGDLPVLGPVTSGDLLQVVY